ncbi:STAS domain-containing protein [Cryptosporangium aurantiacum]|uniref:Anti-sigma factor antagonist n=1 Tax=Cryptosporangium aurantiacum TaxID=134849 RepID=A0A1M7JEB7_9ACTN|nr:STAS domain-containing protein [Cryptosporangium aurantiacum]SHM51328.1 anti-sigma B factor antagonist [Cryptosporangium aurantiacum]
MVDPAGSAAPERTGALGDATDAVLSVEQVPPTDDGRQVVRVGGEIDMLTAPRLRDALTPVVAVPGSDVVLDLDAVTFLGSNGLGVLVELSQQAESVGTKFRLVCANRTVSRPLTLTGLDQVLDFHESFADLPPVGS